MSTVHIIDFLEDMITLQDGLRAERQESMEQEGALCRVETWRGGLGGAYLFPALSSAGAEPATCPQGAPCNKYCAPVCKCL